MYSYCHNPSTRTLYRCRTEPDVVEIVHRRKLVGWRIKLEIAITRADNWLEASGQWHFPVLHLPVQEFEYPRYTQELAVFYFLSRNSPTKHGAEEIDAAIYASLESEYQSCALNNRPLV